jgi:lipopolysaccharide/colanic/teichoic acid biosynthesis glycosyltransferase
MDFLLASAGLLLSAPVWLVLAVAIKLEDGGRVFYSQYRVGKGGELFKSWKFRSMVPDENGTRTPQQGEPTDGVTGVGRLMRKTALDELPQLWNILKGDMSFVGPRALPPAERAADNGETVSLWDIRGFDQRQSVRPGLTGLAQIRASRDVTHRQKFRFDLLYIEKGNIWLDFKLILLSVFISVTGGWKEIGNR